MHRDEPLNPEFGILLVDDEPAWLRALSMTLEGPGGMNHLVPCPDSRMAMKLMESRDIGLVFLDLTMPHLSGEELLSSLSREYPEVPVIVLSGLNQIETAVRCMRRGAFDYLVKTEEESRILDCARRAVRLQELQRENRALRRHLRSGGELERPEAFAGFVGRSPAVQGIFQYLECVARTSQPLLIQGESGTGKEIVARITHQLSRSGRPLVSLNVAGLDDNMFSDTLFGHVRGAFSGADTHRGGLIEQAGEGSLFLDEIGDLSAASQVKLLRLLQEGEYFPLGSDSPKTLRARILVATHQDLERKMAQGAFRKDLFYRLRSHQVLLPPLRKRPKDIALLTDHFLHKAAQSLGVKVPAVPPELPGLLGAYHFPGNVRELESLLFDALSTHRGPVLSLQGIRDRICPKDAPRPELPQAQNPFRPLERLPTLAQAAELLVAEAMRRSGGNQSTASRLLGISQPALSKRLSRDRSED